MGTRSLQACKAGIEKAKVALAQYSLSQNALAADLGLSRQTVNNFFKEKPIDRENFALICDRLGLDIENTVLIKNAVLEPDETRSEAELEVLVQEVRQKVYTNIQKQCGEMRVLDMTRPIELDTIYTDVNILQEITGRRRLDLATLLEDCNLEDFDRLGFAHARTERRSGLQAVEEFDKLMLLGKPGAGKTTFLKRLATLCNAGSFQKHRVPIFITLKDLGDSSEKPNLLSYVSQWLKEMGVQEPQSAEQILNEGRGFLLLDGLDEVNEKSSKQVLQEIQSFSDRFPQNTFVVSCRIAAKEFVFQRFTEVEVADFDDDQIEDFADRWFQGKQLDGKTERFLEKLKGYSRIRELATNPLLLTLLCLVFETRTDFPANRSELYKEGLDVLLKKWDGTRNIEREKVYRELSLKRKEDLLSELAFMTFEQSNYFFKQKDAERVIEGYIQNLPNAQAAPEALRLDSEGVLKSIEAQHGLLVERARGIYSFSHLTFHEYFTARELETRDDLHKVLIPHLTEKRWREVFLLTIGMLKNADSLVLLMKIHIDYLLVNDHALQKFLRWANEKHCSIDVSYKPADIRAFYFDLKLDRGSASSRVCELDHELELKLDFLLTEALHGARDLEVEVARVHDLDNARNLTRDHNLNSACDHDHNLNLNSACDHDLARQIADLARQIDRDRFLKLELVRVRNDNLTQVLGCALQLTLDFNPVLWKSLEHLKNQLPDFTNLESPFKGWWEINGSAWIAQLRTVVIEQRNIGHDWEFDDTQTEQLRQYYDATKLLVTCLNSDCYVSRSVREEIEASLLLPTADIEQRFPNQARMLGEIGK